MLELGEIFMKLSRKNREINMTEGPILKAILLFALPLIFSSVLQLCFNAADMIVVSRWTGSVAMASVGATSSLTNLLLNLFIGMAIGTTVVVSRKYGAKDREEMDRAVHTSVAFGVFLGIGASLLGILLCKPLLVLIDTPSGEVLDGAVLYMRIIFCGTPATVTYNYGAAALRSVGDSKSSLYILIISGVVNVILNLIFVIGFHMGVEGVALATVISKYLSLTLLILVLTDKNGVCKVELKKIKIHKDILKEILKVGLPAGVQNTFTSVTTTIIQSAVNSFGAAAIAGNAAAGNIESFAVMVKTSFRQATVTAVSQNYGAKKEERITKSIKTAMACMMIGCIFLGGMMTIFSKQLLGIYITDSAEAIRYGTLRIFITALPYFISGIVEITAGYLRGIGYSSTTTVNSFIGLIVFRLVYLLFIFPIFGTFESLYMCTPITWVLISVLNIVTIFAVKKKAMAKMYKA